MKLQWKFSIIDLAGVSAVVPYNSAFTHPLTFSTPKLSVFGTRNIAMKMVKEWARERERGEGLVGWLVGSWYKEFFSNHFFFFSHHDQISNWNIHSLIVSLPFFQFFFEIMIRNEFSQSKLKRFKRNFNEAGQSNFLMEEKVKMKRKKKENKLASK